MSYECERTGDTWLYLWHEHQVGIYVDKVRSQRGDLHAYVTAQSLNQDGVREGLLASGNVTLDEVSPTVERFIKKAKERDPQVPWADILGVVCHRTRTEFGQGAPCIDLGLYRLESEQPRCLIFPMLPYNETTMLFADGGSLKSLAALALGLSVATEAELPGLGVPIEVGPVLYVDYESNPEEHARRMGWLMRGLRLGEREGRLVHYRQQMRPVAEDVEELKRLREDLGAKLTIFDSATPACDGDTNAAEVAARLMTSVREVGGTRMVVHHVSTAMAEKTDGPGRPGGSRQFWNQSRSLWEVQTTEARDDGIRTMAFYHRKVNGMALQKHPLLWSVDWSETSIEIRRESLADEPTLATHTSVQYRIREALRRGKETTSELAELLDIDRDRLTAQLRKMPDILNLNPQTGRGQEGIWGLRG